VPDFKIVLQLKLLNNPERGIVTREIDGTNFIDSITGKYAQTEEEKREHIAYWMEERGEDQHASPLELVSYTVESYT